MSLVTQGHIALCMAFSCGQSVVGLAALLVCVVASCGSGNGDATPALMVGSLAALIQGQLIFSREMEREADSYAINLLRANGISTGSLATLFERMQDAQEKRGPKNDWPTYLSTHPPTPERVELFRPPAK